MTRTGLALIKKQQPISTGAGKPPTSTSRIRYRLVCQRPKLLTIHSRTGNGPTPGPIRIRTGRMLLTSKLPILSPVTGSGRMRPAIVRNIGSGIHLWLQLLPLENLFWLGKRIGSLNANTISLRYYSTMLVVEALWIMTYSLSYSPFVSTKKLFVLQFVINLSKLCCFSILVWWNRPLVSDNRISTLQQSYIMNEMPTSRPRNYVFKTRHTNIDSANCRFSSIGKRQKRIHSLSFKALKANIAVVPGRFIDPPRV
jgi:hypothetical protein